MQGQVRQESSRAWGGASFQLPVDHLGVRAHGVWAQVVLVLLGSLSHNVLTFEDPKKERMWYHFICDRIQGGEHFSQAVYQ